MKISAAELQIRRMTPADVDRVMEIALSLKDAPHWPAAAYLAALAPQGVLQRIALVATASQAGTVLGFAVASLLAPEAELETIAVASGSQRGGVGRRLFAAMAQELSAARVKDVSLEVRASNHRALAFYHSLKFVETGRRPRYYVDPVEDALLLGLRLN
jgi:ribosomal-protein-alanine N-acetyltransferase